MNDSQVLKKTTTTGKKLETFSGVVVKAKKETPDTWTLYLFVGNEHRHYRAGQFVSIRPQQFAEFADIIKYFEHIKGKNEQIRAYSVASAPHEKYLAITIKPEIYLPETDSFPPLLSPLLASDLLVGREIELIGYAGAYVMPEELAKENNQVMHLVAGSGIVPSFSIIKDELYKQNNPHIKHTLFFVNKTYEDIIYHQELNELKKAYPKQFSIKYYLTRENQGDFLGSDYVLGRPSLDDVKNAIGDPKKALIFACGPALTKWQKKHAQEHKLELKPRFMEWVQEVVEKLSIDKKHYRREVYG